jgi:hypothetical protein
MVTDQSPRIAHSIEDVQRLSSIGRTNIFLAIKTGRLRARKFGRRTVVLDEDLRAFLAGLPEANSAGVSSAPPRLSTREVA